jgi:hypothetical protein
VGVSSHIKTPAATPSTRWEGYVSFIIPDEYKLHEKIKKVPDAELVTRMAALHAERKAAPHHRRLTLTRQIMAIKRHREILSGRDHPLQHPEVLAHLCFDLLPETVPVPMEELWKSMPRPARLGPTLNTAFFDRFKHLFTHWQAGYDPWVQWIQRASVPPPKLPAAADYTEQDLVHAIFRCARHAEKTQRPTFVAFVHGRLPPEMRKRWVELSDGDSTGVAFIQKHPEVFKLEFTEKGPAYRVVKGAPLSAAGQP